MVQYSSDLDAAFAAVADPTRRGILERLGRREASITELAEAFDMTLTGVKKHVRVLEDASGARTAFIMRFGIGTLTTASTVLQDGDQVFMLVTDEMIGKVTEITGTEPA